MAFSQEVVFLPYADYKVEGRVVFPMDEPHTRATLLVLKR
jgi:hypothetical protein